MRMEYLVPFKF